MFNTKRINFLLMIFFLFAVLIGNSGCGGGSSSSRVYVPAIISDDVISPDIPITSPDLPVTSPDVPQISPDVPNVSPDSPVNPIISPDIPKTSPDVPAVSPDIPVISTDNPVNPITSPDVPVINPDIPEPQSDDVADDGHYTPYSFSHEQLVAAKKVTLSKASFDLSWQTENFEDKASNARLTSNKKYSFKESSQENSELTEQEKLQKRKEAVIKMWRYAIRLAVQPETIIISPDATKNIYLKDTVTVHAGHYDEEGNELKHSQKRFLYVFPDFDQFEYSGDVEILKQKQFYNPQNLSGANLINGTRFCSHDIYGTDCVGFVYQCVYNANGKLPNKKSRLSVNKLATASTWTKNDWFPNAVRVSTSGSPKPGDILVWDGQHIAIAVRISGDMIGIAHSSGKTSCYTCEEIDTYGQESVDVISNDANNEIPVTNRNETELCGFGVQPYDYYINNIWRRENYRLRLEETTSADEKLDAIDLTGEILINEINFPDATFRNYVKQFDINNNNKLSDSEIREVKEINVDFMGISNLKGIEYFTALQTLYCSNNQLTTLDVSDCSALQWLSCQENQLTTLDVSDCTALQYLYCNSNKLTTLDVSKNTALQTLVCDNNQLTTLDVSGCSALQTLWCWKNQLTTLDVSGCSALQYLDCNWNQITTLDVSKNSALRTLYCYNNQLTTLNVSGCSALQSLECSSNQLTTLDVSDCTNLQWLNCSNNQIRTLRLHHIPFGEFSHDYIPNIIVVNSTTAMRLTASHEELSSDSETQEKIVAILPEVTATEKGVYDFEVSFDEVVRAGTKLFVRVNSEDVNNYEFYDENAQEISMPLEKDFDGLTVTMKFEADKKYSPVIIASPSSENENNNSSSGGCNSIALGGLSLIAFVILLKKR